MTMTKLYWLKSITINEVKKTRGEHYGLPLPRFTQYHVPGEKQESSKLEKTGKWGIGESRVCSWATPQITRGTATECESQNQEGF